MGVICPPYYGKKKSTFYEKKLKTAEEKIAYWKQVKELCENEIKKS